jgi:hypothetical protein
MMDSLQITGMEIPSRPAVKRKRKRFETRWVILKLRWVKALRRSKSVSTYQLAHIILFEAFKREQMGGEIVLSMEVTKMPASTRKRATKELISLKLIKVSQRGRQAVRVVSLL